MTTPKTPARLDADKTAPQDKPFPMPGTAWRWLGDARFDPRPSGPHIVASLRWFRDRTEVVFAGSESCAGVEHLMQSEAWEHVPQAHDLTPSEVALAKILAAYLECQAIWKDRPDKDRGAPILDMLHVEDTLRRIGIVDDTIPSARGRALLGRAAKAGVL